MAIRRLLFPEATVSQTASYCLTAGLWCTAQTLSLTPPPPPPPPPPSPMLLFPVGSQSYYFYLKTYTWLQRERRQEKEIKRGREAHGETEWSGRGKLWFFWSCDRCYQCVSAMHVASKKGGLYWFAPVFQSKKWVLNPRFSTALLWITNLSLNKD